MFSAPNRTQVGARAAKARRGTPLLEAFWPKMELQRWLLGPLENRKSLPKRIFRIDGHLYTLKMASGRGVGTNANILWKIMRKLEVLNDSETRLALYPSPITHFHSFRKITKTRCKEAPQKSCFWLSNRALGVTGSIDSVILVNFW